MDFEFDTAKFASSVTVTVPFSNFTNKSMKRTEPERLTVFRESET